LGILPLRKSLLSIEKRWQKSTNDNCKSRPNHGIFRTQLILMFTKGTT